MVRINKFIKTLIDKYHQSFKDKILTNAYFRQTQYLEKSLYIDDIKTKVKIFWLKTKNDIQNNLKNYNELNHKLCWFVNLKTNWSSINFKMKFDLVIVNLSWKVKKLYYSFDINKYIELDGVYHIFIMIPGSIENLDIKINSKVCPMYK